MTQLSSLFAGLLFGAGLTLSGMTDPNQVLAFLNLSVQWSPNLLFVLASAVIVTGMGYLLVQRRQSPLFADSFSLPTNTTIDRRLIFGAILFGSGWGLVGFCPGPAIVSAMMLDANAAVFLAAFVTGLFVVQLISIKPTIAKGLTTDG